MILKHRDKELLRFEWIEPQGVRIVSVNEENRRFLPLDFKGEVSDETVRYKNAISAVYDQLQEKRKHADNSALIDETLISPELKAAMDSYEAFFDEYVEYMKAYNDNPTDAELLMGMSDMLAREADMIKAFDEWEEDHSGTDKHGGTDTFNHGETHTLSGKDGTEDTTYNERTVSAYNSSTYQPDNKDQRGGKLETTY